MRLGDVAEIYPNRACESVNHYTVQRVLDIATNIDGRDLGAVAADIKKVIAEVSQGLPISTKILIRGQYQVMQSSFASLALGMIIAVALVYALLVVLFQSWVDPFIIMMALPGALAGIIWMLALSGTTINVESLMGAIMTVGISVSNSILVVSFARSPGALRRHRNPGGDRGRRDPIAANFDDRPCHGHRHNSDGARPWRWRRTKCTARPGSDRRVADGDLRDVVPVPIFYTLLRRSPPALHMLDARFAAEAAGASPEGGTSHE